MPVLTVDVGTTNLSLTCRRGGHAAPRQVGQRGTQFQGGETSSIRDELMVVPVILVELTPSEARTVRTLFANGAQVPCSGDIFNNAGATIVCSGTITDEMSDTGAWWVLALTLYEVGTALGYDGTVPDLYLTNVASPDGGAGVNLATADEAEDPFSAGLGTLRVLDAASPATCGAAPDPGVDCAITYTSLSAPEKVWLTAATVASGWVYGTPVVSVLSKGGTADQWQTQGTRAKLVIVRASVDVATYWTDYTTSNGGFAGSTVTMTGLAATLFAIEIGDRVRIEFYGRLGLHGGYADDNPADLARQTITYGNGGANAHYGRLAWGGLAILLNPS